MENVMILITGASGNVGKEVLKQIAQTGIQVRAAFQSASKAAAAPSGVEIVTVDYNQPETLRTALKAVERVFLVGPPTAQLPALERKAMEVIAQSRVRQVVKLSAMGGREAVFPRQHAESEATSNPQASPIRFFGRMGLCRTWSTTMRRRLTHRTRFMGARARGESVRLMYATSRQLR